jgi:uncharacterized protein (DUF2164 family)
MAAIKFSDQEKAAITPKIQRYFHAELDQDIGRFEAEFLLDFFAGEIGGFFYNRGLADARAAVAAQLENIDDSLYALEQPTDLVR